MGTGRRVLFLGTLVLNLHSGEITCTDCRPEERRDRAEEESYNHRHCVGLNALCDCVVLGITDFVGVL